MRDPAGQRGSNVDLVGPPPLSDDGAKFSAYPLDCAARTALRQIAGRTSAAWIQKRILIRITKDMSLRDARKSPLHGAIFHGTDQKNIRVLTLRNFSNPARLETRLNITLLSNITVTNLGNFVRTRRRELRITQTELARRVGVDDAYISAIERGIRTPDGVAFIKQLGDALNLDVDGKQELATVATCSQRYIHLSDPLPVYKYQVIADLVYDQGLSEEDMEAIAHVHAAIRRNRKMPTGPTSQGGAM